MGASSAVANASEKSENPALRRLFARLRQIQRDLVLANFALTVAQVLIWVALIAIPVTFVFRARRRHTRHPLPPAGAEEQAPADSALPEPSLNGNR